MCLYKEGHIPNQNSGAGSEIFTQWLDVCGIRGDVARQLYYGLYSVRAIVHKLSHDLGEAPMLATQMDVLEKGADIDPALSEALKTFCDITLRNLDRMKLDFGVYQHKATIYGELAIAYQYVNTGDIKGTTMSRRMLELLLGVYMKMEWVDEHFAALLQQISNLHRIEGKEGLINHMDGSKISPDSATKSRVFMEMSKAACFQLGIKWSHLPPLGTMCN